MTVPDREDDLAQDQAEVYTSLTEASDDARWAFGTGFDDPLAGVEQTVPAGVDGSRLGRYCLMLADDALVSAQRLAEWSTHAPELEEEVALANIGLDLLGQARFLLTRTAAAAPELVPPLPIDSPVPAEDALAFFRNESEFRCVWLVELENGDFARTTVRLLIFSAWRLALLTRLVDSRDPVLAAIAAKAVAELTYHRDWAARWVIVLAQGTGESRRRLIAAVAFLQPYFAQLFQDHRVELELAEHAVAVLPSRFRAEVSAVLAQVWERAEVEWPDAPDAVPAAGGDGRDGVHTEALAHLLAELQSVARMHPRGLW